MFIALSASLIFNVVLIALLLWSISRASNLSDKLYWASSDSVCYQKTIDNLRNEITSLNTSADSAEEILEAERKLSREKVVELNAAKLTICVHEEDIAKLQNSLARSDEAKASMSKEIASLRDQLAESASARQAAENQLRHASDNKIDFVALAGRLQDHLLDTMAKLEHRQSNSNLPWDMLSPTGQSSFLEKARRDLNAILAKPQLQVSVQSSVTQGVKNDPPRRKSC